MSWYLYSGGETEFIDRYVQAVTSSVEDDPTCAVASQECSCELADPLNVTCTVQRVTSQLADPLNSTVR